MLCLVGHAFSCGVNFLGPAYLFPLPISEPPLCVFMVKFRPRAKLEARFFSVL